ncbi:MAG TPA: glycosyltransferase [Anaerolineae bacterium]|nr:glycosyltransferase [Anaerolineae bacterium]
MITLANDAVTFATTLDYGDNDNFVARARPVMLPSPKCRTYFDEVRRFGCLLRAASKEAVLLIESPSGRCYPDLLAAAIIGFWPKSRRPLIVMMGEMWQPDRGPRHWVQWLLVHLADRAIYRYAVQSSEELEVFPSTWGLPATKTRFCPYFLPLRPEEMAIPLPPLSDYVFAGGNSHRDFEPLIEATYHLPELRFIIATDRLKKSTKLPPNVTLCPIQHREYVALTRAAGVVVVPIRRGLRRAAGQYTYLNAMWLGKPTIVNETLGVHDHIRDGETGLIVDGSPESYVKALRWVFDPAHQAEVAAMCARAKQVVSEQFTYNHHIARLLAVLDEAVRDASSNNLNVCAG